MKNQFLKSSVLIAFALGTLTILTLSSCNNSRHEDSKDVAETHNDAKFDNAKKDDAEFLVNAAEINLEEIQLGQLAQTRGTTAEIKKLGKMMETEHTKALDDLKGLAAQKQVTLPATLTDDGMSVNKKLLDTKVSKFDKEYIDEMVSGHETAISKFEKAAKDANDVDIRNWASSMIPILRSHLDQFLVLQTRYEKR